MKKTILFLFAAALVIQAPAWCGDEYEGYFRKKDSADKSIVQEFVDWFKNPLQREEKRRNGYFKTLD